MKLSLGFSPCPNDTFIFDALVNHKIDTEGLTFDVLLLDVQKLNEWAIQGKLDISKISYGVLPLVLKEYNVLNSGGALGKGVGPLLITNSIQGFTEKEVNDALIAIPGENTTANMLFSLAFPNAGNKIFKVFNEIEDWLLNSPAEEKNSERAGVIIHENRFTYHLRGLHKILDLGEYWESETGLPVPLGGIVAKKSLDKSITTNVDRLIRTSIEYAYTHHYDQLSDYVKKHSQEMSKEVMRQHINLYVNDYSLHPGKDGKTAIMKLLQVYRQMHPEIKIDEQNIFTQQ